MSMKKLICLTVGFAAAGLLLPVAGAFGQNAPEGWWSETIAASSDPAGSARIQGGTYTITGDGHDIWDAADDFHYLYKELVGNGSMTCRVVSNGSGSNNWAKGGVMIRDNNTRGSADAYMVITGSEGNGAGFQWRDSQGAGAAWSGSGPSPAVAPPYWVRLERQGDVFRGFLSPDGVDWEQLDSDHTVVMEDTVLIGLCVTSHAAGELRTFVFDNVSWVGDIRDRPPQLQALEPDPPDGAFGVTMPLFQWKAGETALFHDVYLGETPDLTTADLRSPRQMFTMYYHPLPLEAGKTYYWRIDEVEPDGVTVHTGNVWSFVIAPSFAYNPNPRDGDKWIDPAVSLTWAAGKNATAHDVYFGTDAAAVAGRDAGVLVGDKQITPSYEPAADLTAGTTYYWLVDEYDNAGTKYEGDVWSFTVDDGKGGVKGEYFNNMDLSGAPALTRVDETVDFSWGDPGGPGAPIGVDSFSARWTADLEIAVADTYTFSTSTDDGLRLWLNGELIIENWTDHATTDDFSEPIYLEPGVYTLIMEFYENGGGAAAQLFWQTPGVVRQIIPAGPLQLPLRARALYPKNGDVDVPQDVTLMWSAGETAAQHQIYFGDDKDAVAAATPSTAGIYRGQQGLDETTYAVGGLEWNKTYFWRIDEANTLEADSPWKGAVWSFTTANFIVVDDFEGYTNEVGSRVFQGWIDGLGYTEPPPGVAGNGTTAIVGHDIWSPDSPYYEGQIVETADPHGGTQAMPVYFTNSATPYKAEAWRTWTTAQNWTVNGVTDLSLWFKGSPAGFIDNGGGSFTMSAAGNDIWGTADQFRYVYKSLNGNGSITAKVESIENTNAWAKGGVMIREGLDTGAKHVMAVVTPGQGIQLTWRDFTNADMTEHNTQADLAPPYWVRLTRNGSTFTAEHSADGVVWEPVVDAASNTHDLVLMGNVYIGLCLTSHNANAVTIAEFSNVSTGGGVSGVWQVEEVGTDHPDNGLADLYVRLEDSMGRSDTEVYPDGSAVNGWTEWKIPLADFDNVSLSAVKKMVLGIGNAAAPVPDGSGMVLYDDIRAVKPAPVEPNDPNEVVVVE